MLEELKGGLEAPGCSELLWEDQRKTAQLPQSGMEAPAAGAGGVRGERGARWVRIRGTARGESAADLLQVLSGHIRLP